MRISSLHLRNFRNIADLQISPGHAFNLLVGSNAQGKTNIIESIRLISTGTSFRTTEFRDMIRWGQIEANVCAETCGEEGTDTLSVALDLRHKRFLKNGKSSRSAHICTVLFAPEEIMLIRNSPVARRKYMDSLISQVSPAHKSNVGRYEKVLRHRNSLLADFEMPERIKIKNLKPWDDQLVSLGAKVVLGRNEWCARLNGLIPEQYSGIAPKDPTAAFSYVPHCGEGPLTKGAGAIEGTIADQIESRRTDELARGFTVVGPHRDDFSARLGGEELKQFGSQGQHRSFVLALKMSERSLFKEVSGEDPVLLLDDVASELDSNRNSYFFESLRQTRGQIFITATSESDVNIIHAEDASVFEVDNGKANTRK